MYLSPQHSLVLAQAIASLYCSIVARCILLQILKLNFCSSNSATVRIFFNYLTITDDPIAILISSSSSSFFAFLPFFLVFVLPHALQRGAIVVRPTACFSHHYKTQLNAIQYIVFGKPLQATFKLPQPRHEITQADTSGTHVPFLCLLHTHTVLHLRHWTLLCINSTPFP